MPDSKQVKGLRDLVFDTIDATTRLVEDTHLRVAGRALRGVELLGKGGLAEGADAVGLVHGAAAKGVYQAIRSVSRGVQVVLQTTMDPVLDVAERHEVLQQASSPTVDRFFDQAQGALNGLYGDHLFAHQNGLAYELGLWWQGRQLPFEREALQSAYPGASPKLAIFTHGLSCTEHIWSWESPRYYGKDGVSFGSRLQEDLGYTPIYVRHNSGRHVSENGRALADMIERLLAVYPVPVEEIMLVGHSMGGLISRSAAHYGREAGQRWADVLKHVVCLGSPHLGAPLEKGVHWLTVLLRAFPTAGTEVPAAVLNGRSVGIKDLRHGFTVDEEWGGRDADAVDRELRWAARPVPGVAYYYLAATLTADAQHPAGLLLGDILVRPTSASGQGWDATRRVPFRSGRVLGGLHHFNLINHPDVYRAMLSLLADETPAVTPMEPVGS